jgi:hypothetical protein
MCRVFTFYHLCGHVHGTRIIPCPSPIPFTSSPPACHSAHFLDPDSKTVSPFPSCANTTQEPHHYPTLCESCKNIGIISDWFAMQPGARRETVMEWRKQEARDAPRPRARSSSNADAADLLGNGGASSEKGSGEIVFTPPYSLRFNNTRLSRSRSKSSGSAVSAKTFIHLDSPAASALSTSPPSTICSADSPASSPPTSPSLSPAPPFSWPAKAPSTTRSAALPNLHLTVPPGWSSPRSSSTSLSRPSARYPSSSSSTPPPLTAFRTDVKTTMRKASQLATRMAALNRTMKSRLPVPVSPPPSPTPTMKYTRLPLPKARGLMTPTSTTAKKGYVRPSWLDEDEAR